MFHEAATDVAALDAEAAEAEATNCSSSDHQLLPEPSRQRLRCGGASEMSVKSSPVVSPLSSSAESVGVACVGGGGPSLIPAYFHSSESFITLLEAAPPAAATRPVSSLVVGACSWCSSDEAWEEDVRRARRVPFDVFCPLRGPHFFLSV